MKSLTHFFLLSLCGIFLFVLGCDKVDGPFIENAQPPDTTGTPGSSVFTDTTPQPKIVLLEDYTGHRCGNCPKAADAAQAMKIQYGEQVVPIAIHAGLFSVPENPGKTMTYDFRTATGTELDIEFGISAIGNPNGMVNRKDFPASNVKSYSAWGTVIAGYVSQSPSSNIFIVNQYSASDRKLIVHTKTKWLSALSGNYKLAVYLTEDSIVKPQLDYRLVPNDTVYNYVHRHVLRAAVNSTWGDALIAPVTGSSEERTYTITLDAAWIPEHCEVIAFVYDAATYEIVQASEKKVVI